MRRVFGRDALAIAQNKETGQRKISSGVLTASAAWTAAIRMVRHVLERLEYPPTSSVEEDLTCGTCCWPYFRHSHRCGHPKTVAYQIFADESKKPVPSDTYPTGGGFDDDAETEWVIFYFHLPLDFPELDAEAAKILAKLEQPIPAEKLTSEQRQQRLEAARPLVGQHRAGHFQVECDIMDDDHVMGIGTVELEVLFKGRFSDVALLAAK